MKIFARPGTRFLSEAGTIIPSPLIYNSSFNLQRTNIPYWPVQNHLSIPNERTNERRTNFPSSTHREEGSENRSLLPSKTMRKKRGGGVRGGGVRGEGPISVVLEDRRGEKVEREWDGRRPCRKSVANSCRPKRIREKRRGGPGTKSRRCESMPRRHWWPPWKFWKTTLAAVFWWSERARGRAYLKETFLVVIEAVVNEGGGGGGAVGARAPGSALNGHKWQTNTAVGSASTLKVETSRATRRATPTTFHCSPSTFLPSFLPRPPVDFSRRLSLVTRVGRVGNSLKSLKELWNCCRDRQCGYYKDRGFVRLEFTDRGENVSLGRLWRRDSLSSNVFNVGK